MYDGNKQIFVFFFTTYLSGLFFFTFGLLVVMDSQLRSHVHRGGWFTVSVELYQLTNQRKAGVLVVAN